MNETYQIKEKLFHAYYRKLNDKQKEAVLAPDGPVLVIAGAGSGKTTVLINRISYLVQFGNALHNNKEVALSYDEKVLLNIMANNPDEMSQEAYEPILAGFVDTPCPPDRILAITFTNKAAGEIKERLRYALGDAADQIWAGTFHSVCVRLLRRFSSYTEYGNDFVIYDQNDCKKIIADLIKEKEIDNQEITPKTVMSAISNAKNRLETPEDFEKKNSFSEKRQIFSELYHRYQKKLLEANALDFDDLICQTVKLLSTQEEVRSWCQRKFQYVLVDEYQDTNHAQYLLMKLISDGHRNVMVVGDDDQSIYKFRGAVVENILNFDKQFQDAKVILLEQNYRSSRSIIHAANAVIANNRSRRGKTLWSNNRIGRVIDFRQLETPEKEAEYITETISLAVQSKQYRFGDIAVLYRTKAQSNILETVFSKSGIPHRLLSGVRFYDHAEVKDILAYLRFLYNRSDFVSFHRIINVPRRGIGQTTVNRITQIATDNQLPIFEVLKNSDQFDDLKRSSAKLKEFAELIDSLWDFSTYHTPAETVIHVIERTGYMATLQGEENEERRKNVDELISTASLYESKTDTPSLGGFLEEVALVSDVDNYNESANSVVLMTVHASKGLEFPMVFLAGLEENLFPSPQSSQKESDLEEERRLAYVAMTRAKEELIITASYQRMVYGKTNFNPISRFVLEIPEDFIQKRLHVTKSEIKERNRDFYSYKEKSPVKVYTASPFDQRSYSNRPAQRKPAAAPKKEDLVRFIVNDRVTHGIFGSGTIVEAKDVGADILYKIQFDHCGEKKLMATYAKLKKI